MELLEQRPQMYQQLRRSRKLLTTMEMYARELNANHKVIVTDLATILISSQAMEMAELLDRLPPVSDQEEHEALSLDQAMRVAALHSSRG